MTQASPVSTAMDGSLEIVFLATEFSPMAKVGGLGDVVAALSSELARMSHRVTVIVPAYRRIFEEPLKTTPLNLTRPLLVPLGARQVEVGLWEVEVPGSAARLLLIDYAPYFDRPGIYDDPDTGEGYADNDRRFVLFQRAALEALKAIDLRPDLIHLNDNQTGLVATYLKTLYAGDRFFERSGTLFTIHNLGYQGIFPAEVLTLAGLPMNLFYPTGPLEFWGRVNFMKGGILFADQLSTVSPRYAAEIQGSEEYGFGLEGVLRVRSGDLTGILNGIDTAVWDPATDASIPHRYTANRLDGKGADRQELLARVGLPLEPDRPVLGMISRLVDQKGLDLLAEAADRILDDGFRLVVLGTGQKKHEEFLQRLVDRRPDQVAYSRGFDDPLAHLIEAGSDFFLMPSKYEPCGLNQMISLRYGTPPIVRETGGLIDTVEAYDEALGTGTGFRFQEYTAGALVEATRQAQGVFGDPDRLAALRRRAMAQDFSWSRSAREYVQLYHKIMARKELTAA